MKALESQPLAPAASGAPASLLFEGDAFRQLAESIPQLVWTARPDGFHDYFNSRWYAYTGRSPGDPQGGGWQDTFHPEDRPEALQRWRHSLSTGEPYEVEFRRRRHDGLYRWFLVRAQPVRDAAGHLIKWFGTCTDIDEQKRAAEGMRFLAEAGTLLSSNSLDYEATLAALTRLVVPRLADWCSIDVVMEDGSFRLVGVAHVEPEKTRYAYELRERYPVHPDEPHGIAHVIRTGQTEYIPEIPDALLVATARDPEQLRIARALGLRSAISVPLQARGRTLGALALVNAESGRLYTPADVTAAEQLAARAALAVDNARLYRDARRAEERFRSLVTATSQAVWVTRPDGFIEEDSPSWRAFTGQTPEEWRGHGWMDAVHPEDRERAARLWNDALARRVPYEAEYRLRRPGGGYSPTLARGVPVLNLDGTVREWVGTTTDMTLQRQAEAHARSLQLEQSARRFAALRADVSAALAQPGSVPHTLRAACEAVVRHLGAALARVWLLDKDGATLHLRASAGTGTDFDADYTRIPVEPDTLLGRIAQERRPVFSNDVLHASWMKEHAWAERERLTSFAGYPLVLGEQLVGVFVVLGREPLGEDTTEVLAAVSEIITQGLERRRAEESLKLHAQELARSNEELQQFAYVASHDLQEPLRMVASYTQLLARRYKGKLDADADDFIHYAVDGVNRMQRLIQDLLAYSRVGTQGRELTPCDSRQALERALANLRAALEESHATLDVGPLPRVLADGSQLTQLFQNLVGNALKFHGEAPPRVEVRAEPQGAEWRFTVKDNGIGIDPQYFERIFVIFQRLHGKEEYAGTGIGLSICKKIVERHGGRMGLDSQPGQGATFWFTLAAVPPPSHPSQPS